MGPDEHKKTAERYLRIAFRSISGKTTKADREELDILVRMAQVHAILSDSGLG